MTLSDILGPDGREKILGEMTATDRWEAIDELIDHLVKGGKLKEECREQILEVIKKRESSMSTGIGFGIGIPHASTDLIDDLIAAFGRSTQGINFDALDNQPVKIVVLLLVPKGQFQKHLHTLASVAKVLHPKEFRKAIEAAADVDAIWDVIQGPGGEK